jgi:hypothetical protein
VPEADNYHIQIDDSSDFSSPVIEATMASTSYAPTFSLSPDVYYWRVRGHDYYTGYGSWSSVWSLTILVGAPTLSSPSDGLSTSDLTPTFEWYSVPGADRYQIQIDDSSDFSSPAIDTTTVLTSYMPTFSLSRGVTYYWRVRGYNSTTGYGDWSSTRDFFIYPSVTITFHDSDTGQPLTNKSIYISTDGSNWIYWDTTDNYGRIIDSSFEHSGNIVYFRVEEGGEYDVTYKSISKSGERGTIYIPPSIATRVGRLLPWALLIGIPSGTMLAAFGWHYKRRKLINRTKEKLVRILFEEKITKKQAAKKLGVSEKIIEKSLKELREEGVVE